MDAMVYLQLKTYSEADTHQSPRVPEHLAILTRRAHTYTCSCVLELMTNDGSMVGVMCC